MDLKRIVAYASQIGVSGRAMADLLRRAEEDFAGADPDDKQLATWGERLKVDAAHLFEAVSAPEVRLSSPSERLTRGRGAVPVKHPPFLPSTEQQKELGAIASPVQRLSRMRAMMAEGPEASP
jgi:hypothetical protein